MSETQAPEVQTAHEIRRAAMVRIVEAVKAMRRPQFPQGISFLGKTVENKAADGAIMKWTGILIAECTEAEAQLAEIRAAAEAMRATCTPGGGQSPGPITLSGPNRG